MRVALLALHFAEYAARLALALSDRHEVLLVLRPGNARDELSDELRAALARAVTIRWFEPRRRRDPRILLTGSAVNRILRGFSPDLLHIQEIHPVFGAWTFLSFYKRIPVVVTVHDAIQHSGGLSPHGLTWKIQTWFRRNASRVIVHGPRMRGVLEQLDGGRGIAERVDVIPHGTLGRSGAEEDISGCEPGTFLFFGRIHPYKGLRYLLQAGEVLKSRGHRLQLLVAGSGDDVEPHRQRMASSPWVELIERYIGVEELPGVFRRASAVVLPYTDATQSGVSAMAFAFARPVIATDVGDVPDVVIDGESGLIVPPRDGGALADAMEKVLLDRTLRDSLATGAARLAKEKLSWPRIADATDAVYRRAMVSHSSASLHAPHAACEIDGGRGPAE